MASIKVYMQEEKEKVIVGVPEVKIALSKKLTHPNGDVVYFIDKNEGMRLGLNSKMKFNNIHPIKPSMCEITIPIERI